MQVSLCKRGEYAEQRGVWRAGIKAALAVKSLPLQRRMRVRGLCIGLVEICFCLQGQEAFS